jgi:DNA polymerase-3 subunit delta'
MANPNTGAEPTALLERALATGRIASAYLLSGPGQAPREAALRTARALVCRAAPAERPCGECLECRRTHRDGAPIEIDGTGKRGPLYRHVGDHPDLIWVERGPADTRVRIGQVRAVQNALRLGANEGGWRAAVVADAEWLNQEAQNALLRLLEEPPEKTCLLLVSASAAGLLATIRSRCQRVRFPVPPPTDPSDPSWSDEARALAARLDAIAGCGVPELLDWAEEFRGERAVAARRAHALLEVGSGWLRARVRRAAIEGRPVRSELDAFRTLGRCRKDLDQRNANPQMIAERALFAVREAIA